MGCAASTENNERSLRSVSTNTENAIANHKRKTGPKKNNDRCELFWQSSRPTYKYHWWPLRNKDLEVEDSINNLYAKGGGIDKYDTLFGTEALEYQRKNHCIEPDSERTDKLWAGFCDRSASLSCLFKYPCNPVIVKFNNREMEFSPRDIEALMIIAVDNATRDGLSVFYGTRNNMKYKASDTEVNKKLHTHLKSEPLPLELLEILKRFSTEDEPFVMDIDNGDAVWNYPFDKVEVTREPIDYGDHRIPKTGKTILYRFQISSTAYKSKNMDITGYVNYENEYIKQAWLSKKNPDFLWKEYARSDPWTGQCSINPKIYSYHVYRIYQQSVASTPSIVLFK